MSLLPDGWTCHKGEQLFVQNVVHNVSFDSKRCANAVFNERNGMRILF